MTRESHPFVSVVTPVYNGELYLSECIESVLAQTYENFEYVLVNNCSTDKSLEIMEGYARKHTNIRVENNKTFLRVIANHNHTLRQISPDSKYCKVVMADDWIFPECISKMVQVAEQHESIGIVGAYGLRGDYVDWDGLPYPSVFVDGRELCRSRLLGGPYIFGNPTSLLLRSDLIRARDPFYNENNLHADTEVCFDLLKTYDFGFVHQVLTYTRVQEKSLTSFSQRMNTYLPAFIHDVVHYGSFFLNEDERRQVLERSFENYYKFLAKNLFHRRDDGFWKFHEEKLKALGYPLNRTRLYMAAISRILNAVLNPKLTVDGLVLSLRQRARG